MPLFDPDDACPCGSGEKYRDCCLVKPNAQFKAMCRKAGFGDRNPEEILKELQGFMADPELRQAIEERLLPISAAADMLVRGARRDELLAAFYGGRDFGAGQDRQDGQAVSAQRAHVDMVFSEWVLAQAKPGEPSAALAGAPRDDLPQFSGSAFDYVEEFPGRAMSLYEVQEIRGDRVLLLDLLVPRAKPVWAAVQDAGQGLFKWDIAGIRLLGEPQSLHLSPGICCMPRELGMKLARELKAKFLGAKSRRPKDPFRAQNLGIVHGWLGYLAGEFHGEAALPEIPSMPKEVALEAKGTLGEVAWDKVETVLDRHPEFDREGAGWIWSVEAAPGLRVPAARLERWMDALAGAAPAVYQLRALVKRLSDIGIEPAPLASFERLRQASSLNWQPAPLPVPADRASWGYAWLVRKYLGLLYTRMDCLDEMMAKEMLAEPGGKARVAEFLKLLENVELQRRGDAFVPAPLDLRFLWREFKLEDMLPESSASEGGGAGAGQDGKPARARIIPFKAATRR